MFGSLRTPSDGTVGVRWRGGGARTRPLPAGRRASARGTSPPVSHTAAVLAQLPGDAAQDLLARLDRVVPGRIEGFYVVGSASMGAFQPGRSDVDFVAIVDGDFDTNELRRLRGVHVGRWSTALMALR